MVAMYVSREFMQYRGGVHDGGKCDKSMGHSMVLVGHGRQDGMQYWLFKNSHGPTWGERGYYKLNKKTGRKCFMAPVGIGLRRGFLGLGSKVGSVPNQKYDPVPIEERFAS